MAGTDSLVAQRLDTSRDPLVRPVRNVGPSTERRVEYMDDQTPQNLRPFARREDATIDELTVEQLVERIAAGPLQFQPMGKSLDALVILICELARAGNNGDHGHATFDVVAAVIHFYEQHPEPILSLSTSKTDPSLAGPKM